MTTATNKFKALLERLCSENRFFHMEDDIDEFDMFSDEEKVKFGAIIDAAYKELGAKQFAGIAFSYNNDDENEE